MSGPQGLEGELVPKLNGALALSPPLVSSVTGFVPFSGYSKEGEYGWVVIKNELHLYNLATTKREYLWKVPPTTEGESTIHSCLFTSCGPNDKKLVIIGTSKSLYFLPCGDFQFDPVDRITEAVLPAGLGSATCLYDLGYIQNTYTEGAEPRGVVLNGHLIAVGTSLGHLYLFDIKPALTQGNRIDLKKSGDFMSIFMKPVNRRELVYTDLINTTDDFYVIHSTVEKEAEKIKCSDSAVTCIKYFNEVGSVVVGYEFGGFQIWSLESDGGTLKYASPVPEDPVPVTHITTQRIEKLGRGKVTIYLWITNGTRDAPINSRLGDTLPRPLSTSLHTLTYFMTPNLDKPISSMLIPLLQEVQFIEPRVFNGRGRMIFQEPITLPNQPETPYLLFAYEQFSENIKQKNQRTSLYYEKFEKTSPPWTFHIEVFDLCLFQNRASTQSDEYRDPFQPLTIPSSFRPSTPILSLYLPKNSVRCFSLPKLLTSPSSISYQKLPERVNYLSFELPAMTISDYYLISYKSGILMSLERALDRGPWSLLEENAARVAQNLTFLEGFEVNGNGGRELEEEDNEKEDNQKTLFNLCLHYNASNLICELILKREEMDMEENGDAGYILHAIDGVRDWAWETFSAIEQNGFSSTELLKKKEKTISVTLRKFIFEKLCEILERITDLFYIFKCLQKREGSPEMQEKINLIQQSRQYFQVVIFFLEKCILDSENLNFSKEAINLQQIFQGLKEKRSKREAAAVKAKVSIDDEKDDGNVRVEGTLMIDHLLESLVLEKGLITQAKDIFAVVDLLFFNEFSDNYPRKMGVLLYFVIEIVSAYKEDILPSILSEDNFIYTFCSVFKIVGSVQKTILGLWFLDNLNFTECINLCLEASDCAFLDWSKVMRALYDFGEYSCAFSLISSVNPPLPHLEDVVVQMMVLLHNGYIRQAFMFQRKYSESLNGIINRHYFRTLMYNLMDFCEKRKLLMEVFNFPFPLSQKEENYIITYLKETNKGRAELLFIFYLQKGYIAEAEFELQRDKDQQISQFQSHLINQYKRLLPTIKRKEEREDSHDIPTGIPRLFDHKESRPSFAAHMEDERTFPPVAPQPAPKKEPTFPNPIPTQKPQPFTFMSEPEDSNTKHQTTRPSKTLKKYY
eukprot:TRINITY_DN3626_c0_g1_i1.p1 TRINITY_DN3626_c0_g1~~TRINITY_DN3626_c0_g1_i1.p1  ORF type:complete len:1137 (-),score=231.01 TRINITY_DN3626_c0_g1_i1:37-3447(-)